MAALTAAGANASTVLYYNLGDSVYVNSALNGTYSSGQSFTSGATDLVLDDLQLELDLRSPAAGGYLTVYLYSDNSNTPGTQLDTLGVIDDSQLSMTAAAFDVSLEANPTLTADTQYWIMITGTSSVAAWDASFPVGGDTGTANEYVTYGNGSVYDTSSPPEAAFQMSITADPAVVTAPEPSSVALLGAGLALAAALWRRRGLPRRSGN